MGTVTVCEEFISHRTDKAEIYNMRGRTESRFLQDLDCEIVEFTKILVGEWFEHPTWHVDAITREGHNIDVKFVQEYWNLSKTRTSNIMRQYGIVNYYHLYEWVDRPKRPLEVGDVVSFRQVGVLSYEQVMQSMMPSKHEPGGYYVAIRKLLP